MKTKFIAEISSNHNRSLIRAMKLITAAKRIRCDAVKFQFFKAEKLYAPEFQEHILKMREWELPYHFVPHIAGLCRDLGLKFGCSAFHIEAVDMLKKHVDFFKIGSYELLWTDLIEAVALTGKPWMISAGMEDHPSMDNVRTAISIGMKAGNNLPRAIFHCNSNYPAKPENCNLEEIQALIEYLSIRGHHDIKAGWSDHTVEPGVIHKAIENGAEMVEFHLDLSDKRGVEAEIGHCWRPAQMLKVIRDAKVGEVANRVSDSGESEAKKWRTDPEDGLRPMRRHRKELLKGQTKKRHDVGCPKCKNLLVETEVHGLWCENGCYDSEFALWEDLQAVGSS